MFISIAAIIGKGRYFKTQVRNKAESIKVRTHVIKAEYLLVAQDFIFNAVLINTAVDGNHQESQENKFDIHNQKTSLSLLNFFLVIFSAILAEIIVSSTHMIAITIDVVIKGFTSSINSI
ncbi:MAG: hypothetical protein ACOZBL_02075 [Patescibacteria group bacterium]